MLKLQDKNGTTSYRENNQGAVLARGQRQIHLMFKSANAGERARNFIADKSFDFLFKKGKKMTMLGNNVSYLRFEK